MAHTTDHMATLIRRLLAPLLLTCPPECGIVTITSVQVSGDGGVATLRITALKDAQTAVKHLRKSRREIAEAFSGSELRRVPEIRWQIDFEEERLERLDELLK